MNCAPVLIFTYKRLDTLKQAVAALQKNDLAAKTHVVFFSDGAKKQEDMPVIEQIREYLKTVDGFKEVTVFAKESNQGLAASIINGVTQIINQYNKVIVLEDDLLTSKNFLTFMNKALFFYENNAEIFSIAGYTPMINEPKDDVYFTLRGSSWGWATWKDRWEDVEWDIKNYGALKEDEAFRSAFNKMGSDMFKMLNDQMTGKINSWAIRWTYHQFKFNKYTVFPTLSKIQNIGMGKDATHTYGGMSRFKTNFDDSGKTDFDFVARPVLNNYYLKQFLKPYSIATRIKYKILNSLKF
ncbi:MAG: glycosyltransferase [Agriterribacter sp.]